jgi:hypothetical protein
MSARATGGDPTTIQLGGPEGNPDTYKLRPQRIGRISRKLEAVIQLLGQRGGDSVSEVTGATYDGLKVFIPDLAPQWKLAGYPNAEAWEAKEAHAKRQAEARDAYARQLALENGASQAEADGTGWADLDEAEQLRYEEPPELADFEDPYDPEADASPTPPEILDAIEGIFRIHGGDRLVRLVGKFVSPETIRAQIERFRVESNLKRSARLRQRAGGSAQTSSGTTDPT